MTILDLLESVLIKCFKGFFSLVFVYTLLLFCNPLNAQTVSPYSLSPDWYFGVGGRLQFSTGNFPSAGSPTASYHPASFSKGKLETSTSLCFSDMSVAIYSNARRVYNGGATDTTGHIRNLISDGKCFTSSSGGAVSFPDPQDPTGAFYLVTANDITGGQCTDGGLSRYRFTGTGSSVSYSSGPTLMRAGGFMNEAVTVGADGTGGYWLVGHDRVTTNIFNVWHFTAAGISGPVNQDKVDIAQNSISQSYLKFSPCMNKLAFVGGSGAAGVSLIVYEFDNSSGTIGNELRRINGLFTGYCGLEFSPDGNTIYYSRVGAIVNYCNISTGTTGTITSSKSWSMQLGLDGKIYTSPENTATVGVISNTNNPASASYTTMPLPGGGSIISGLSNIGWLNPFKPKISATLLSGCSTFSHKIDFNNYFNGPVSLDSNSIEFSINGGAYSSFTKPKYVYTSPGDAQYTISARFRDAYCGQQWVSDTITVTPNCALPVQFVNISAISSLGLTKVFWSTSLEINSEVFQIQRSTNGRDFKTIGTVLAAGNSRSIRNYTFLDNDPVDGIAYYRVIEKDFNGNLLYSAVVSTDSQSNGIIYSLANNPFTNEFYLNIKCERNIRISIYDAGGKEIHFNKITHASGSIALGQDLNNGMYMVEVIDDNGNIFREKVIKH